ncbi:MAG: MFS transporter [Deltaproteobacteria bacterium]|nr:MAG: MFS transporter [Deltaproteobacteria bacterium]
MSAAVVPARQPHFLGHPVGLFILFFTEMWERFSYYGMRGLLKLYMVNYLFVVHRQVYQGNTQVTEDGDPSTTLGYEALGWLLPESVQGQASVLYGWYTGLVYLTPLFGGILADWLLGQRKAVVVGGVLMALGHFVMAAEDWFFPALILLILGNGLFKPNVSTQVGGLYPEGDPRRDGAFTIFYMGINLGAFLSNLVCGTLAALYGWHYGFGAAGVGMVLGLVVYLVGGRYLPEDKLSRRRRGAASESPHSAPAPGESESQAPRPTRAGGGHIGFGLFFLINGIAITALTYNGSLGDYAILTWGPIVFGATQLLYGIYRFRQPPVVPKAPSPPKKASNESARALGFSQREWLAIGALVALCALNIVFWAVYEQQGNTMQTWADEKTIWPTILGFTIPSTWFQSLNPLFIFMMAPLLDMLWGWQSKAGYGWSSVTKMAVGCTILGMSFLVMVAGAQAIGDGAGSLLWPVLTVFLLTVGELYLSPIGLSLVTKVSPVRIVSMMMGMWFLSSFFGNLLSGYIGVLYDLMPLDGFFLLLYGLGVGAGLIMFALARPLKRALGDV